MLESFSTVRVLDKDCTKVIADETGSPVKDFGPLTDKDIVNCPNVKFAAGPDEVVLVRTKDGNRIFVLVSRDEATKVGFAV